MTAGQRIQVKFVPNNTNVLTLKASNPNRLDRLADVTPDNTTTANNSTLVYDPLTDKYVVKLLDLDGGVF